MLTRARMGSRRAQRAAPERRHCNGRHQLCSPARKEAASEAFDTAVKIAFLSFFMTESQDVYAAEQY